MEAKSNRVLGVLAGGDMPLPIFAAWAQSADILLAADGAADALLRAGAPPDVTIGDFDSLRAVEGLQKLVRNPDQSTSDADKLLAFAAAEGHEAITLMGVEGDRLDHVLASLASAARSSLCIRLVLRTGLGWIVRPGCPTEIETRPGDTISLLPLVECAGVDLSGVRWPLSKAALSAIGLVSISNVATEQRVRASLSSGAALLTRMTGAPASPSW